MKKILLYKVVLISSIACLAMTPFSQPSKKVVKQVQAAFDLDAIAFIPMLIEGEPSNNLTEDSYYSLKVNDSLIGYAVVDKAPSKTAFFDYLVVTDKDLSIVRSRVITYREEYGGAIGSYRWLKQFIGKKPDSDFTDIAAISGATISVQSMKKAIIESLETLHKLKSQQLIP
jgi:Na+-translocating ferredoxin:NAD+ oxidoreductase RnfG subunit